jgi:hypothetical protein
MTFWYSALVKPEAAVLGGDLHPEGAELAQAVDHVLGILAGAVDLDRVHLLAQELREGVVERAELRPLGAGHRERVDQIEAEIPQEQLAHEARVLPRLLTRRFGDLARLLLGE